MEERIYIPVEITDTDRKPHQERCEITQCNRIDQTRPFEISRVWFKSHITRFIFCGLRAEYLRFSIIVVAISRISDSCFEILQTKSPEISDNKLINNELLSLNTRSNICTYLKFLWEPVFMNQGMTLFPKDKLVNLQEKRIGRTATKCF